MHRLILFFLAFLFLSSCQNESAKIATNPYEYKDIITSDIPLFWEAYDKIQTTDDSVLQMQYLQKLFLDKGSIGLRTIQEVRNYQPEEYLEAIRNYPEYWKSIRENTLKAPMYAAEIQKGVDGFKEWYPDYRPAKVYFEIGVFRTPGTALDSVIMIGAELAMSDEKTVVNELPESMNYVRDYVKGNPVQDLAFLNVHEYVHSQQTTSRGYDLLSQSVFEGSAEFIAEIVTGQASIQPAIAYGKANDAKVKKRFTEEMYAPWIYNWIWNSKDNEFSTRDLGYYIGYAIVSRFYEQAADKKAAFKTLIELDYTDPATIESFVQATGYFDQPLDALKVAYEDSRPEVAGFKGLDMNATNVKPGRQQFTVIFDQAMDKRFRSTDFGALGKDHFPKIETIEFSDDGRSATYTVLMEPNTNYDMMIESGYRNKRAIPLKPFNLKFRTGV
ncbi:MAG: hypothetical protein AAF705_04100 [Bacteroidota bacterium]